MARPEPLVLMSYIDEDKTIEILDADAVWVIYYRDQLVTQRDHVVSGSRGLAYKYPRTAFYNSAHAYRLCRKLNKLFDTQDFWVREIK
jgi:hypothetical protein